MSSLKGFSFSWVFGCPGHGKGTWDGLGGIVKNKTGKFIKADDLFLSSPYEVFEVIHTLFASDKAQARFDANPKTVIKEWKIMWVSDNDINRPKIGGISENKISDLKAFHGVGTRGLFSFKVLHRDGFAVKLSGCHCCYCIRGYCPGGFGTTPLGCLSGEPTQYLVCQRSDVDWSTEKKDRIERLSIELAGKIQEGQFLAVASSKMKTTKSTSDIYGSFDICKVLNILVQSYTVCMYSRSSNSNIYSPNIPSKIIIVLHSDVRYIITNIDTSFDDKIHLDIKTVENIIINSFNGRL